MKETNKKLFSADTSVVLKAIEKIKKEGSESSIEPLLELYNKASDLGIKEALRTVFFNMKEETAPKYIAQAIKSGRFNNILHSLVASCWESGQDYSEYLDVFVDVFITTNDYMLAFDAFTVIENNELKLDNKSVEAIIERLKDLITHAEHEKKLLTVELINGLKSAI